MSRRPLASVVIATHNGQSFLERTLSSVLAQSVGPVQVIVCDDGSTDGTRELLAGWSGRLTVVTQENRGVSAARNHGARLAAAPWLAFLDHDDVWEPRLLERQIASLSSRSGCGLAYADSWIIDDQDRVHGLRSAFLRYHAGRVHAELLRGNFIPIETVLMPRAVFRSLGGFDESLHFLEDYDFFLRLTRRYGVAFCPEPLARYRIHDRNLSRQRRALLEEWVTVLERLAAEPGRPAAERALIEGERARRAGEVAWQALKRGDLQAAEDWMARAGARCPTALAQRVKLLHGALSSLPDPLARKLLATLPGLRLYGVR